MTHEREKKMQHSGCIASTSESEDNWAWLRVISQMERESWTQLNKDCSSIQLNQNQSKCHQSSQLSGLSVESASRVVLMSAGACKVRTRLWLTHWALFLPPKVPGRFDLLTRVQFATIHLAFFGSPQSKIEQVEKHSERQLRMGKQVSGWRMPRGSTVCWCVQRDALALYWCGNSASLLSELLAAALEDQLVFLLSFSKISFKNRHQADGKLMPNARVKRHLIHAMGGIDFVWFNLVTLLLLARFFARPVRTLAQNIINIIQMWGLPTNYTNAPFANHHSQPHKNIITTVIITGLHVAETNFVYLEGNINKI